uniref:Glycosyltransferase family 92 protein n=1 Tax=Caenorhabditis japonica TaxID=281687 RepID=A0A8R1ITY8_CAEJA
MFNIIYSILPPNDREHIHRHSHTIALILRLCRDFYLIPILLVFINILLHPLPVLLRVKNAYTFKLKELENDEKDLFFVSAYYYEQGVYENQVSLVFVAPRDAQWERRKLIVIRSNEADSEMEVMKVVRATPHNLCKFVTLVGTAVLKNDIQNLKIVVNWKAVDIRYLPADNTQRDLVVCTPPIYHSVRWQNVLLAAHVYSKFGGHLQSYIYSVTPALFKLFEELKRLKGISVDAMPDFYGSKNLGEIEFGGVTVSNCDCLNKYKVSVLYLLFECGSS